MVIEDFHKIFPDIENSILETKLKRFVYGEPIPDTGYFIQLPSLQKPINNIHFAGDYTDEPWLGGAFFSGLRAANELGINNNIWTQPFRREIKKFDYWLLGFIFILTISIICIIFYRTIYRKSINYIFHNRLNSVILQRMIRLIKPVQGLMYVLALFVIVFTIFIAIYIPISIGAFRLFQHFYL